MTKHVRFFCNAFIFLGLIIFAPNAMAQNECGQVQSEFSPKISFYDKDRKLITQTKSENDLRFVRDYKGKNFAACVTFHKISGPYKGTDGIRYLFYFNPINLTPSISTTISPLYGCEMTELNASKFVDATKGDRYLMVGAIDDANGATILFNGCTLTKLE